MKQVAFGASAAFEELFKKPAWPPGVITERNRAFGDQPSRRESILSFLAEDLGVFVGQAASW